MILLSLALLAPAHAADAGNDAERARQLREQAAEMRRQGDANVATAEQACLQRFQVFRCINDAKTARMEQLRQARQLEAEARELEKAARAKKLADKQAHPPVTPPPAAPLPHAATSSETPPPASPADQARMRDAVAAQEAKAQAKQQSSASEAAARADAAARDRERYDERLRSYEKKQAEKAQKAAESAAKAAAPKPQKTGDE